jgi:non-heme chloroperoxidase
MSVNEPAKSLPSRRSVLTTTVGIAATMTLPDATLAVGMLADVHDNRRGQQAMSTITAKDDAEIYYKDWGTGPVVTFSHGWPLNADAWDGQMMFLMQDGYRCIAHDRRGHGRSSQASAQI